MYVLNKMFKKKVPELYSQHMIVLSELALSDEIACLERNVSGLLFY